MRTMVGSDYDIPLLHELDGLKTKKVFANRIMVRAGKFSFKEMQ